MRDAVVVGAVRSPVGRRNGGLAGLHPVDLSAQVLQGLVLRARYGDSLVPQGISAELIAEQWSITRDEADRISLTSQERAAAARASGRFEAEIVPVTVPADDGPVTLTSDEGIRPESSLEKLGALRPVFRETGIVTAGNSSQISDGAAALLITTSDVARRLNVQPLARLHAFSVVGVDPVTMLTGPVPATQQVLDRAGLKLSDIGAFEINEAFATVLSVWQREIGADPALVNPNGGAID